MAEAKKKRKEKKITEPKDKASAPAVYSDNLSGGTVQMVPKWSVAIAISESPSQPPAKKLKGPSTLVQAIEKLKQPALNLEDSASPQTNKDLALQVYESVLTWHNQSLLKGEKLVDIHDDSLQLDIKVVC